MLGEEGVQLGRESVLRAVVDEANFIGSVRLRVEAVDQIADVLQLRIEAGHDDPYGRSPSSPGKGQGRRSAILQVRGVDGEIGPPQSAQARLR